MFLALTQVFWFHLIVGALKKVVLLIIVLTSIGAVLFYQNRASTRTAGTIVKASDPDKAEREGKLLVKRYCSTCHLTPSPSVLPKESWPQALGWMGNYLGLKDERSLSQGIVNEDQIPNRPIITRAKFQLIKNYLISHAPTQQEILNTKDKNPAVNTLSRFEIKSFSKNIGSGELISLLKADPASKRVYVGFGSKKIQTYTLNGNFISSLKLNSEPSYLEPFGKGYRVSVLGDLISDRKKGEVLEVSERNRVKVLEKNYHRLTQSNYTDIDNDGRSDLLMVGYGDHHTGRISIFWNRKTKNASETVLSREAGALCASIYDFNGDGKKDIMVLTAQGRNDLVLYLNGGNRTFKAITILKDHAGFGYQNFTLSDLNKDGDPDIIICNGNNMEWRNPPLKSYHGVRILINNGNLTFKEKYFYPMFGAMKAIASDFDNDGDLDIAAISFFPYWNQENPETFTYLENIGDFNFKIERMSNLGWKRWMTMDAADLNGDKKTDILLGEGNLGIGIPEKNAEEFKERHRSLPSSSVMVLINK